MAGGGSRFMIMLLAITAGLGIAAAHAAPLRS